MPIRHDKGKLLERLKAAIAKEEKKQGKDFRRTAFIDKFAEANSISRQTLYRDLKKLKDGGPESLNDKRGKARKNKTIIDDRCLQTILVPLIKPGKSIITIIKEFRNACIEYNNTLPSDATVRRYINKILSMPPIPAQIHSAVPEMAIDAQDFKISEAIVMAAAVLEMKISQTEMRTQKLEARIVVLEDITRRLQASAEEIKNEEAAGHEKSR